MQVLNFMLDKLAAIEQRYDELNQMLMEVGDDYQRAAELNMERTELESLVKHARQYRAALQRQEEAQGLLDADDEDLRELAEAELAEVEPLIEHLEKEIKSMLLPSDKRDQRNVIVEIRAYISTRTRINQEKIGDFQKIFLARGRDHAGNQYGDPTVSYIDLARTRTKHMRSGH